MERELHNQACDTDSKSVGAPTRPRSALPPGVARRIENTQMLVSELSKHEMHVDEIARFLKLTQSGARKYIRELREANVIELDRYVDGAASHIGKAVYRLSSDPERVRVFLSDIVQTRRTDGALKKKAGGARLGIANIFHILADDVHHAIRVHRSPAQRDPLVAALFGPAQSQEA